MSLNRTLAAAALVPADAVELDGVRVEFREAWAEEVEFELDEALTRERRSDVVRLP